MLPNLIRKKKFVLISFAVTFASSDMFSQPN